MDSDLTASFTGEDSTPAAYARALLNILEDFGSEQQRLETTQRAVLNILDDLATEKARLEETQQAVLRSEQAIRGSLREKDLLLGEIHHRVKNNLQIVHSLLDMQANLTTDARAASALRDSQNRIQSMALIHQTLYQSKDFAKVDFGHFLDTLMVHLQSSYGRRDLILSSHSDAVRLVIDRAIPCGLIVNELVTNALKHAFPDGRIGHIKVEMRLLDEANVEVSVSDNGAGISDSLDLETLSSLGMQLVHVLAEQLHAQLRIQRRDPTRIAISFPL